MNKVGEGKSPSELKDALGNKNAESLMAENCGTIRCSHILVKHRDSLDPSSCKKLVITRSKSQATEMIAEYRDMVIRGISSFSKLAEKYSECPSSKEYGNLGEISLGMMPKQFDEVAFRLKIGHISRPVETELGIHLIFRNWEELPAHKYNLQPNKVYYLENGVLTTTD